MIWGKGLGKTNGLAGWIHRCREDGDGVGSRVGVGGVHVGRPDCGQRRLSGGSTAVRCGNETRAVETNAEVVDASQIVILAVKPQQMSGVLAELKGKVTAQHLVISIAAGVPLKTLVAGLGETTRLESA